MAEPRLRRLLSSTSLAIASVLASLALIEGVLRLVLPPPQIVHLSRSPSETLIVSVEGTPEDGVYVTTLAGKRLRPNIEATIRNHALSGRDIVVRTNSLGFRGPELETKTMPRALFLGDSVTLADYVAEDETFVSVVARAGQQSDCPIETVNAGVGAIGTDDYVAILKETGLRADPDLVIVALYLNDHRRSRTVQTLEPPAYLQGSYLAHYAANSVQLARAMLGGENDSRHLAAWGEEVDASFAQREPNHAGAAGDTFQASVLNSIADWGGAWTLPAWEQLTADLKEIQETLAAEGVPLVLVLLPVREQVESPALFDFPQRQAKRWAKANGVAVIDVLPALRDDWARRRRSLFYDHCHANIVGNRIVGRAIFRGLTSWQGMKAFCSLRS